MLNTLQQTFKGHQDAKIALQQAAYMKNLFPFLGLKTPTRVLLQKGIFVQHPIQEENSLKEIIKELYTLPEREYHYAALDLAQKYRKLITDLSFIRTLITTHSWWDSVDTLASNILGYFLKENSASISHMDQWIQDPNMWIRRSALLYQLKWKKETDSERLFHYSLLCSHEKEFFIRKAIGWVLREYSKHEPSKVASFITLHKSRLSPLSLKEASKYI